MRIRITAALLCAALLFLCTPRAQAATPSVSAQAAVVYLPQRDTLLYNKAGEVRRPIASTTKLMTALLAAERLDTTATVQVPAGAVPVEGTQIGLAAGDTLTVRDLLAGLLLASGNDAANALALLMAPTMADFAAIMNERARALGMTDSYFVTPSGLDEGDNGSTARDMALLAAAVLEQPLLATLCGLQSTTVTLRGHTVTLQNHNKLLRLVDGCIGLKTGYTRKAGRCLVSAVQRDGVTLIAVTLNAPSDWDDHAALYDYAFDQVHTAPLTAAYPTTCAVAGGTVSTVPLTAPSEDSCVLLEGETLTARIDLPTFVWAPLTAGETVGQVRFYAGDTLVHTVPLRAARTVGERALPSAAVLWWRRFIQIWIGLFQ